MVRRRHMVGDDGDQSVPAPGSGWVSPWLPCGGGGGGGGGGGSGSTSTTPLATGFGFGATGGLRPAPSSFGRGSWADNPWNAHPTATWSSTTSTTTTTTAFGGGIPSLPSTTGW